MAKRLKRKLIDVINEVKLSLISDFNVTQKDINQWQKNARRYGYDFPECSLVALANMWIDYEIQRDVIYKHIIHIMKTWDPRLCSPGSACVITGDDRIFLYDAQHRAIAAGILGYTEIPCAVVKTDDLNFPSYAFEKLNKTGVESLTLGDLHRNSLVRYKNGVRDIRTVRARTMQDQFDLAEVDLQDKKSRTSVSLRGDHNYFYSHFKSAQQSIDYDQKGKVLFSVLNSIKNIFPKQEEIDQGVFIGLIELHRLAKTENFNLPNDWTTEILKHVSKSFKNSHTVHKKAKSQWKHVKPGAAWSAPSAMSNFLREIYMHNGGKLKLPYHGEGSTMQILNGNFADGLFPNQ